MNQFFIAIFTALLPACVAQEADVTSPKLDSAQARQAAVEANLLPRAWAKGHTFGMTERMGILNIPGVSVAVIHNGQIDWAAGYGVRDAESGAPVTTETLFQAASISKPVSALATLRLAQEGRIDLDAPINDLLSSYKLPEADFEGEVTPRRILNHTAGLNVSGFAGYRTSDPIPSAPEVIAGLGNSDQVLRIEDAGKGMRYSGGGSTMLQVALVDTVGQDFASIVREKVLEPLGMKHSTYAQPLDTETWPNYSSAHDHEGDRIPGGFHVYPEQFPAGLWTTPSDIARFAIEIQRGAAKQDGRVLEVEWSQAMLTPEFREAALGLFITNFGGVKWFRHSGSNQGFKCDFRASFSGGHGVVVMANSEMSFELCADVIRAVAKVYEWPGMIGEPLQEVPLTSAEQNNYVGRYAFNADEVVSIDTAENRLTIEQPPYPRLPLAHLGKHRFQILGTEFQIDFSGAGPDKITSLSMSMQPDRHAQRLDR